VGWACAAPLQRLTGMARCMDQFDGRLSLEITPDAYGPEEQALSWYCYLEEHREFPFDAECVSLRSSSPPNVGDKVSVVGMPTEEDCTRCWSIFSRTRERWRYRSLSSLELTLTMAPLRPSRIGTRGSTAVTCCRGPRNRLTENDASTCEQNPFA